MKRTSPAENATAAPAAASANEPIYGFGRDTMPLRDVLGRMAKTEVKSERTSSIPFAQFMLPSPGLDRLLEHLILFCNRDGDLDPADIARHLEYPVDPCDARTGRPIKGSLPSMSDAMLLAQEFRVAVEGKWTEPIKYRSYGPSVRKWLAEGHSPAVLDAWLRYLKSAGAIRTGFDRTGFQDVPYQLLHRAASACYGVVQGSRVRPAVCYVVFRAADATPEEACATRDFEKNLLGRWTDWVVTDALKVVLVRVTIRRYPTTPMDGATASRLFLDIAAGAGPYAFDWPAVTIVRRD